MQSEPPISSPYSSRHQPAVSTANWIFDELPSATIVSVSRPDASDISPMLLSYTIEFQYKQFKWRLLKKAAQVFYLHFALKKRAFIDEFHEKQEQPGMVTTDLLMSGANTKQAKFFINILAEPPEVVSFSLPFDSVYVEVLSEILSFKPSSRS